MAEKGNYRPYACIKWHTKSNKSQLKPGEETKTIHVRKDKMQPYHKNTTDLDSAQYTKTVKSCEITFLENTLINSNAILYKQYSEFL